MGFVKKIPDALLGGIPSAVGAVAGGYMQSRAANKATEATERATTAPSSSISSNGRRGISSARRS
jgi:F0F1-type ATP synthase membrane subunit c/vacuolar-type H+-ATPase subunit K